MIVKVFLPNGEDVLQNVAKVDPALPGCLRVMQQQEADETSASGLVVRVTPKLKHTLYPWHRVLRVDVEDA